MEELKKPLLFVDQNMEKFLICNKGIRANDASIFTGGWWKTLTNLVKTWSSVVLPVDCHYYEYTPIHELIDDRKTAFYKQYCCGSCRPASGRHLISINSRGTMKKISLAWKLQQHHCSFHQMHLCWTRYPGQPEPVKLQNSLSKFVFFAMKYVHAIPMLIKRVDGEFVNSKVKEIGWWMLQMQLAKQMIFM